MGEARFSIVSEGFFSNVHSTPPDAPGCRAALERGDAETGFVSESLFPNVAASEVTLLLLEPFFF